MIVHTNRGRLTVEIGGKWRLYTNTIPAGAVAIGIVSRGELGDKGALVQLSSGTYVQINAGVLRNIDGRKVAAGLGTAGRPAEMSGGKKVNTYLDAESIAIATRRGHGNVGEGIRMALKQAAGPPAAEVINDGNGCPAILDRAGFAHRFCTRSFCEGVLFLLTH